MWLSSSCILDLEVIIHTVHRANRSGWLSPSLNETFESPGKPCDHRGFANMSLRPCALKSFNYAHQHPGIKIEDDDLAKSLPSSGYATTGQAENLH
mmetsp:Transcript_33919/g.76266  ORF Transcript_33919/g.76266 Transcript_33919/m.76266 type:complete len:96 (-) Transcript_33919:1157-1444(-)